MANKMYKVTAEKINLTVCKGSIVSVDARQFELAKNYLVPISAKKAETELKEGNTNKRK